MAKETLVSLYNGIITRSQPLLQAAARMNLNYLMLSQRGQIQKATCCGTPFIWHSGEGTLSETESRSVGAHRREAGLGERLATEGHKRTSCRDGSVLCLDFDVVV